MCGDWRGRSESIRDVCEAAAAFAVGSGGGRGEFGELFGSRAEGNVGAADAEFGEGHEEEAAKGCAEEGAIDGLEAAVGRRVDIKTAGAEELDGFVAGDVAAADGQDLCLTAVDAWAGTKVAGFVLLGHLLDALARGDVALVDQAVQHLGAALHDGKI